MKPPASHKPNIPLWGRVLIVIAILAIWLYAQRGEISLAPPAESARIPTANRPEPAERNDLPEIRPSDPVMDEKPADPDEPLDLRPTKVAAKKKSANSSDLPGVRSDVAVKKKTEEKKGTKGAAGNGEAQATAGVVVKNVTLKDESGRVIYRGDVDLEPTLDRIAAGKMLRFPNDGSTFQNRERRLPQRPAGYYREYVVPTAGESGPGPQRLVVGQEGETYYTHDHYKSFRKIR